MIQHVLTPQSPRLLATHEYLLLVHRVSGRSGGGVPALSYRKRAAWRYLCSCCSCSFCCCCSCCRPARRSAAAPWPTTSPAPLRLCFGTTAPRPPSPLGAQVTFCSPSEAGCWGGTVADQTPRGALDQTLPLFPEQTCLFLRCCFCLFILKCVLCVVREYVQNFYMPCPYMLSVLTRYFDDSRLTRNPDVAEEASEW